MEKIALALLIVAVAAIAWIVGRKMFASEGFEYGAASPYTTTVKDPYPWFARIHTSNLDGSQATTCGASLIAPSILLTAAHCVRSGATKTVAFIGGVRFDGADAERRDVVEMKIHPEYDQKLLGTEEFLDGTEKDVAIMRLSEPSRKTPILMIRSINDIPNEMSHIGYGRTEGIDIIDHVLGQTNNGKPPEFLQKTPMYFGGRGHRKCVENFRLFSYKNEQKREELESDYARVVAECPSRRPAEECAKIPSTFEQFADIIAKRNEAIEKATKLAVLDQDKNSFVCAFGKHESLCMGDSGGPLFVEEGPYLVGVTSTVPSGCNAETRSKKMPNFFASVIQNKDWILKEAGIVETSSGPAPSSPDPSSPAPSSPDPSSSVPSSSVPSSYESPPPLSASYEPAPSPSSSDSLSSTTWWIIGGSVGGLVLVLGIVAAIIMMRK